MDKRRSKSCDPIQAGDPPLKEKRGAKVRAASVVTTVARSVSSALQYKRRVTNISIKTAVDIDLRLELDSGELEGKGLSGTYPAGSELTAHLCCKGSKGAKGRLVVSGFEPIEFSAQRD